MIYYHIITLGCQMNKSDSERVSTVMGQMGYKWTEREEDANLLGIIACSVRQKAIDKVYSRISKWNRWKNKKNLITFVTGCILPADRDKFLRLFDLTFQISDVVQLPAMIRQYGVVSPLAISNSFTIDPSYDKESSTETDFQTLVIDNKKTIAGQPLIMKKPETRISGFWHVEPHYESSFEAFIPIQNGCDKFCTFCAVPYTRGREISRPSQDILEELKTLVQKGYKSITLLGQNVNSYGLDKKGNEISFPELLEAIGQYGQDSGKEFWLYFTSPHPRDMSEKVLQMISRYKCLAKQIHLPLQSGDNLVLSRMNRSHTYDDYLKVVNSIRRILPSATLFTDIIVGFSSETEEQFQNTFKAMEDIRFNMAYIARYSPRPGAVSSRWTDDISQADKKERLHCLSQLLQQQSHEYNKSLIGKTLKVLVSGTDRKQQHLSGLTEGKIIVRFASDNKGLVGLFVDVEITSAAEFAVEGKLVKVYQEDLQQA
jgi:tRNA-2-methylthio-N6-dimethylallyladenosine synthase